MKTSVHLLLLLLGGVATLPFVQAEPSKKLRVLADASAAPAAGATRDFVIRAHRVAAEMETVAFLGVETAPVPPALTAQLALPKNSGLVVRHIVPESPAAAVLQVHDILLKLDDQRLIEPRQFSVLVRNHAIGDEVTLTYVRGGKETTAKLKLAQQQAPALAEGGAFGTEAEGLGLLAGNEPMPTPGHRVEMDRVLSLLERPSAIPVPTPGAPGLRSLAVNPANSNLVYSDEEGSLELTIKDGRKSLVAKDAKGASLFAGPVDTPEQREALPPAVRERLDRLESMQGVSFEADDAFHGDIRLLHPAPRRIKLPLGRPAWTMQPAPPAI